MIKNYKVIGLMSGSSLDGLDIAYVEFELDQTNKKNPIYQWQLIQAETAPLTEQWVARLAHLPKQSALNFAKTHTYFAHYMAELVNSFIKKHQIKPDFIASHGHTIFHDPDRRFTTQIGDGAALATLTQTDVFCDFRSSDIAIDGEGTPLAPIADKLLFEGYDFYLNLGGIANISCNVNEKFIAFDIAAANQVFNALANTIGLPYDYKGQLAQKGQINEALLKTLNEHPYFQKDYPKSLDNQQVVNSFIIPVLKWEANLEDKLHTFAEHLAQQLSFAIDKIVQKEAFHKKQYKLFITGGGAFNDFLVNKFKEKLPKIDLIIPDVSIIEYKEAILMALMGVLRKEEIANCLSSVTGARRDTVGGAHYLGK